MTEPPPRGAGRLGHWLRGRPWLPRAVGLGWAVYLPSQLNIARVLGASAEQLVALQTAPSHARMLEVLASWSAEDRAHYAAHLPFDVVHACIYPLVLALSLAWGFRAAGVPRRFDALLWLALLAGVMDQAENAAHYLAVRDAPDVPFWLFATGFAAATTKWVLALSGLAALPVLTVLGIRRRRARSSEAA